MNLYRQSSRKEGQEPRNERPPKQKQRNELDRIAHKRLHRKGPILPMKERLVRKKTRLGSRMISSLVLIVRNDQSCTILWLIGVRHFVPSFIYETDDQNGSYGTESRTIIMISSAPNLWISRTTRTHHPVRPTLISARTRVISGGTRGISGGNKLD